MKRRRIYTLLAICCTLCAAQAQTREMMAGAQVGYASSTYLAAPQSQLQNGVGLGARFHYELMHQLVLAPKTNVYLNTSDTPWWAVDAAIDVHYNFVAAIDFCIYPIVGICTAYWDGAQYFPAQGYLGGNFGLGAQYNITTNLTLNGEYKYQVYRKRDVVNFALSLGYRF
jgi:hypothetical protein